MSDYRHECLMKNQDVKMALKGRFCGCCIECWQITIKTIEVDTIINIDILFDMNTNTMMFFGMFEKTWNCHISEQIHYECR